MANKFKVGDIIKGTPEASKYYAITTEKMTKAKVTEILSPDSIRLKILEHTGSTSFCDSYVVSSKFFELADAMPTLKPDYVVKTRDDILIVHEIENGKPVLTTANGCGWIAASDYDKDGNHLGGSVGKHKDHDIIAIYGKASEYRSAGKATSLDRKLVWERPQIKELTMEEVAKLAGCDVSQLKIRK